MTTTYLPEDTAGERPRRRLTKKDPTPQFTAASPATPITTDTRPTLAEMRLPGPRRAQEGRGGSLPGLTMIRLIIRNPLLPVWVTGIVRSGMGRPGALRDPDLVWSVYLLARRHFASEDLLDQELRVHWQSVREEFWFEHRILLPDAKPNGDIPLYARGFEVWRTEHLLKPAGRVREMARLATAVSAPLAAAIRTAEEPADAVRDPLTPTPWDCMSMDGTVMDVPSGLRGELVVDDQGEVRLHLTDGISRARTPANARLHTPTRATGHKRSGSGRGLFNVAAVTKGLDTYTRVALGGEIGDHTEGEVPVAMRLLHQIYNVVGDQFPVLLYDGALTPVLWHELTRRYGIYCVNANYARPRRDDDTAIEPPTDLTGPPGVGKRLHGRRKNNLKLTYVTPLPSESHTGPDGQTHLHHLVADDGGVYELNRPWRRSDSDLRRLQLLTPTALDRRTDERGEFYFLLTLTGRSSHGDFNVVFELRDHRATPGQHLRWDSQIANIRILPEALFVRFAAVFNRRNHIESFFSWLEQRFIHKDRHAVYGLDPQRIDLLAVCLLENVKTWAHLALRHPTHAAALHDQLAALGQRQRDQQRTQRRAHAAA